MYKPSFCVSSGDWLCSILRGRAQAAARITGSSHYPGLSGEVRFFQTGSGVIVCARICGHRTAARAMSGFSDFIFTREPNAAARRRIPLHTPCLTITRAAASIPATPETCRRSSETMAPQFLCF